MARRYDYQPLSAVQFRAAMRETGVGGELLSRLTGFDRRMIQRWQSGQQPVHPVMAPLMAMLTIPEAKDLALKVMDEYCLGYSAEYAEERARGGRKVEADDAQESSDAESVEPIGGSND